MSARITRLTGIVTLAGAVLLSGAGAASARSVARPTAAAPSAAQIQARLRHTIEIGTKGEYFRPIGKPLTIRDGRGTGTLTAQVGGRFPTADGLGQIVFFWHNATFVGLSSSYETFAVVSVKFPAAGTFVIRYVQYRASDPTCCPTLPPRKVTYAWSGHILISNGVPPKPNGKPTKVKYQP